MIPRMPAQAEIRDALLEGLVIPAHPLALTQDGRFDEKHQRALTRYYLAAGAGGIAVGVHTTQFAIREPAYNLLEPVLALAAETMKTCDEANRRQTVRIAGITGKTAQAVKEATLAKDLGYHAGLLSLAALGEASEEELLVHAREVGAVIPLFGFYLQPAVGGRPLSESFWATFSSMPEVIAIKIAPFDRYKTLDVLRGVAASGRADRIALYTGNDDQIILDLLTPFRLPSAEGSVSLGVKGGLLGHWACWTRRAVEHLERCKAWSTSNAIPRDALTLAAEVTDANAAFFDAANNFRGCIAGIHYVLRKQGLMASTRCLDPAETLSPGQQDAIERVFASYPHLSDDAFVKAHLHEWLR